MKRTFKKVKKIKAEIETHVFGLRVKYCVIVSNWFQNF